MDVRKLHDPAAFLEAAGPFLLSDEARHNLMFGIAGNLRDHSGLYQELRGWIVEEDRDVLAAALQTPPFNLVLARPARQGSLEALVAGLVADDVELPGVTGAAPEADEFAHLWTSASGLVARTRMRQRIYKVTRVQPVTGVRGKARAATSADRTLVLQWAREFAFESFEDGDPATAARQAEARLERGLGGFALWEDEGRPVSLAGWGGRTPNGARIGPVYTPPDLRRRGYASALTAWVSAERLASGCSFCVLYTDLANPTSNRIYMNVGYEPVCDSCDYAFEPPPA